jgi:hypothetical protein
MRARLLFLAAIVVAVLGPGCNWKKSSTTPGTNLDALDPTPFDRGGDPPPGQPV